MAETPAWKAQMAAAKKQKEDEERQAALAEQVSPGAGPSRVECRSQTRPAGAAGEPAAVEARFARKEVYE